MGKITEKELATIAFFDCPLSIRMAALDVMPEDSTPQDKADILNLLEYTIEGEMSPEDIVDQFINGNLPARYVVKIT